MTENIVVLMQSEAGRKMVREKCKSSGLSVEALKLLIEAEMEQVGKLRKRGIREEFDEIFGMFDTAERM